MKMLNIAIAFSVTLWVGLFIGTAMADDGVGVCILGTGTDVTGVGAPAYVGVTVSDPTTGGGPATWDNSAGFETECCAEAGQPADCFAPVG